MELLSITASLNFIFIRCDGDEAPQFFRSSDGGTPGAIALLPGEQTRIDAYISAIGSPRVARAKISTATEMLDSEFARADMILNDRIDGLMEQFKNSGTSFYADYKNARRIVDTGGPSASPTPPPPPTP